MDILPSTQYGTAEAIHQHCGSEAVAVALYGHNNHVRAYEVHGKDGPYLLTVAVYDRYLTLCRDFS